MHYTEQEAREVQLEFMRARGGITEIEFQKEIRKLYYPKDDDGDYDDGGEYR